MGFLDHSTNNIIVDAVLTAEGRAKLAAGNLVISSYTFFDTEVDYSIIKKYGVVVGKEKIEKNTAILEASTSSSAYRTSLFSDTDGDLQSDITVTLQASASTDGIASGAIFNITINNSTGNALEFTLRYDTNLFSTTEVNNTVTVTGSKTVEFTDLEADWSTAVITVTRNDIGSVSYVELTHA